MLPVKPSEDANPWSYFNTAYGLAVSLGIIGSMVQIYKEMQTAMKDIHSYIKEGIMFQKDTANNIYTAILSNGSKGTGFTEETALKCALGFASIGQCAHCKQALNGKYLYLNFAGDNLHAHCLIEYLQDLGVLKAIMPETAQSDNVWAGIIPKK